MKTIPFLESSLQSFEKKSNREQILIFFGVLLIFYSFWTLLFVTPLHQKINTIKSNLTFSNDTIVNLEKRIEIIQNQINEKQSELLMQTENSLVQKVALIDKELNLRITRLIVPQEMMEIVHNAVDPAGNIRLVSVETDRPEAFLEPYEDLSQNLMRTPLYQNGLHIKLIADYPSTVSYLKKLEDDAGDFFWDTLTYKVKKYPLAEVDITFHIISKSEGFYGSEKNN